MNRIVKEHYPAERLPDDLRSGLSEGARVTVIIETSGYDGEAARRTIDALMAAPRDNPLSAGDVDLYLRSLRDEWNR